MVRLFAKGSGVTLRRRLRSSGLRRASLRARGRRFRRSIEALGTEVIERRPGPPGPKFSITLVLTVSSLFISSVDDEQVLSKHKSFKSE